MEAIIMQIEKRIKNPLNPRFLIVKQIKAKSNMDRNDNPPKSKDFIIDN